MTKQMTREQWLDGLFELGEQVGDCVEWQGPMLKGITPVVYVPRGYLREGMSQGRQSARQVLWSLNMPGGIPDGHILRSMCCNSRCVAVEHMVLIARKDAPKEQGRRGEFSTPKRNAAAISRARARETKLDEMKVRHIRTCDAPSRELASLYHVSRATINAVRRGDLWPEAANGSSVFAWRPAA